MSFVKFDTKKKAYPIIVSDSRGNQYKIGIDAYRAAAKIPEGLPEFFVQEQKVATIFKKTFEAPSVDNYMKWAVTIYGHMSPENLTCDGELPRNQAVRKLKGLREALAYLERIAGKTISEDDANKWYDDNKAGM